MQESSEAADDAVIDLVDYCHRKLTLLAGRSVCGEILAEDRITHVQLTDGTSIQVKISFFQSCRLEGSRTCDEGGYVGAVACPLI